jgi:hypothetical protein
MKIRKKIFKLIDFPNKKNGNSSSDLEYALHIFFFKYGTFLVICYTSLSSRSLIVNANPAARKIKYISYYYSMRNLSILNTA